MRPILFFEKKKGSRLSIEKPNLAPSKNDFRNTNRSIVLSEKVTRISHQNFLHSTIPGGREDRHELSFTPEEKPLGLTSKKPSFRCCFRLGPEVQIEKTPTLQQNLSKVSHTRCSFQAQTTS